MSRTIKSIQDAKEHYDTPEGVKLRARPHHARRREQTRMEESKTAEEAEGCQKFSTEAKSGNHERSGWRSRREECSKKARRVQKGEGR